MKIKGDLHEGHTTDKDLLALIQQIPDESASGNILSAGSHTGACQQLYVWLLKAMRWSSQYCLFLSGCPNIGTEVREDGGKSWSYPKHLGMEGDKDYSERLIRGAFCVVGKEGQGRGQEAKGREGQFPPGHALLRSDEKKAMTQTHKIHKHKHHPHK